MIVTQITLLIPAFALLFAPPVLTVWLHGQENAPLPLWTPAGVRPIFGFGPVLEPRWLVGPEPLDQRAITLSLKDGCF